MTDDAMNDNKLYVLKTNLEKGINSILHIVEYDSLQELCDKEHLDGLKRSATLNQGGQTNILIKTYFP